MQPTPTHKITITGLTTIVELYDDITLPHVLDCHALSEGLHCELCEAFGCSVCRFNHGKVIVKGGKAYTMTSPKPFLGVGG